MPGTVAARSPLGRGALAGLKVVEFAHVIAGPLAGTLIADLGADVVHVEDPGNGDPQRVGGPNKDGVYLWWKIAARNKRSVTLDLRKSEGRQLALRLAAWADVVITNMRVSTLQKWELDFPSLQRVNNKLVMLQVSGYGTNTTNRNSPGFGKVGEAMSGVVNITGFPDGPPVHTGFSHADSVTGLMGAFAIQAALYRRSQDPDFNGEWIDLALFESLFRLIEWQVLIYDQLGVVPQRAGNQLAAAPAAVINTYKTGDGQWLTVTSGTPRAVRNVAQLLGEPAEDYLTPQQQVARRDRLDDLLRAWIAQRTADECVPAMAELEVVASRIYTMDDIAHDETYREREDIIEIDDHDLGRVRMQGVVPKMVNHPGEVWRTGPQLGQDNELVYQGYLGMDADEYEALKRAGVI
jgi:formyl-CoA transferase